MSNKINFEGTIDRIEDNVGVILLGSGEEINLPTDFLPFDADEGSLVKISIKVINQENLAEESEEVVKEPAEDMENTDYEEEMFYED